MPPENTVTTPIPTAVPAGDDIVPLLVTPPEKLVKIPLTLVPMEIPRFLPWMIPDPLLLMPPITEAVPVTFSAVSKTSTLADVTDIVPLFVMPPVKVPRLIKNGTVTLVFVERTIPLLMTLPVTLTELDETVTAVYVGGGGLMTIFVGGDEVIVNVV